MRLIEMSAASRRIHFGTSGSAPLGSQKALDRRWSFDHISLPIRRLTLSNWRRNSSASESTQQKMMLVRLVR